MSKVLIEHAFAKDSFFVAPVTIASGWIPGQCFQLNSTGEFAVVGDTDNVLFVGVDATTELSSPPTGSLLTGIYGSGTKFTIDHTQEVNVGSATRAYSSSGNPESGAMNANLYVDNGGKWTTTATGSVKGKMVQIPAASNNYGLGIILRF